MVIVKSKPSYQQGELDMLCGVYSLLNIIQLLCPKSKIKSQKLFFKMLRHLEKIKHQNLSKTITNGLTFMDMKRLFNVFLMPENLTWGMPFRRWEESDLDQYWDTLKHLLESKNACCVLIRLTGTYNHWTIVKAMTENTLMLFDSDGHSRINRGNCCMSTRSHKPHILWPKQTVLIYRSN